MSALPVVRGREQRRPFAAKVDVAVVGSGAGGAVVARELARDGRSVIVLEEGGHYAPEAYAAMSPSEAFRRLAREAAMSVAVGIGDTPLISLLAGRCVGGSSVLTGAVCFRIPDEVLHRWGKELGLTELADGKLDPFFDEVERACHVEEVSAPMRSRATERLVDGADKLGIPMKPMRRNTLGCRGSGRCNFGCPHGAKLSVDVSFLPDAAARGASIVSDALVERIDVAGGRARGVRGRFLDAEHGEPGVPFDVRAKVVVVACGSMHTPLLLRRSGLDSPHIGRHLTMHPAVRIGARFDEAVDGWDGATQSVYSDHFLRDGILINGIHTPVNLIAAGLPGFGHAHRKRAERIPNIAMLGAMVHDEGGGQVRRWFSREPLVLYRMARRDRERLFAAIRILGRIAFAAGAREVFVPVFGSPPIQSPSALDRLTDGRTRATRVECAAFHPLGSARMATTPAAGVVKPTGEAWSVENLFVCDGSVLPTSTGVNSQVAIMGVALKLARGVADDFSTYARRV